MWCVGVCRARTCTWWRLPQLKVVKILKHAYEVAHITLATVAVKRRRLRRACTDRHPENACEACCSAICYHIFIVFRCLLHCLCLARQADRRCTSSMRATLHCLTIGGTLHRWTC